MLDNAVHENPSNIDFAAHAGSMGAGTVHVQTIAELEDALARAKDANVLQPIDSTILEVRIPSYLQDNQNQWFGFSQRARIIFYDAADVSDPPQSYFALAHPDYAGMICHRSSSNVYSQTLLAAMIENHGEAAATKWAQGVVDNFAREPQGGGTDQLRGLVSGECDIAISNTY